MISSTTNPHVKFLRSLRDSVRVRRSERSLFLEGVRLVAHALASGAHLQRALYAPQQLATTPEGARLLQDLAPRYGAFPATPEVVAAAADTRHPQGVVAAVARPELPPRPGLRLLLDGIQDPGNLGTLLRSAEAAGVGLVMCAPGSADPFQPKAVRAAMGAHCSLPLQADLSWPAIGEALAALPTVYAADADATLPYFAADWHQPAALIIGNEAHGFSPEAAALASQRITIPMVGHAESLNAAIAGSIILFEALRQRS
ncbi:TrmH family RNA methyltransferase [Candidatus Chloroploca asiatica]|uniref:rRNA methyltransferase n=1 Tax=Candidatus Chloroploca asiatica TaxID=1506545 RepID=A0A2H3KRJ8_9CHLR|nr:RNA methyltransferase [Candidatus Chloroploca asiatica]PDW01232.1 rRNA methyltransferase [Candidatus Chloroploca asiatica]